MTSPVSDSWREERARLIDAFTCYSICNARVLLDEACYFLTDGHARPYFSTLKITSAHPSTTIVHPMSSPLLHFEGDMSRCW